MYQWSERRDEYIVWPRENRRSGASDHEKNQEKAPGALTPPLFSLPSFLRRKKLPHYSIRFQRNGQRMDIYDVPSLRAWPRSSVGRATAI